jgi:hypothetical protein
VDLVHDFIRCALTHDAIADPVFELLTSTSSARATTPR